MKLTMRLRFALLAVAVSTTVLSSCGGSSGDGTTQPTTNSVASVTLSPDSVLMKPGGSARLSIAVRGTNGAPITGKTVSWSSADNSKATVSQSGQVTAAAVGRVTITATSEGKSGTTVIVVANTLARDFS